jgi:hypothetical protein
LQAVEQSSVAPLNKKSDAFHFKRHFRKKARLGIAFKRCSANTLASNSGAINDHPQKDCSLNSRPKALVNFAESHQID